MFLKKLVMFVKQTGVGFFGVKERVVIGCAEGHELYDWVITKCILASLDSKVHDHIHIYTGAVDRKCFGSVDFIFDTPMRGGLANCLD
jgi:hypothetical protein